MRTLIKKYSEPIIDYGFLRCIGTKYYLNIYIYIYDLCYRVHQDDIPKDIVDKYLYLNSGKQIIINNFSGETLNILLLNSHIYWNCESESNGEFVGIMWDKSIEYHSKRCSPVEIIKYCEYGKYLQNKMICNVKPTMSCYGVLLLLINSFIIDCKDCLIKSKVIMAYMRAKYSVWECDFTIKYSDNVMEIFDEKIYINLDKKILEEMGQVFNILVYDGHGNLTQLDIQKDAKQRIIF